MYILLAGQLTSDPLCTSPERRTAFWFCKSERPVVRQLCVTFLESKLVFECS